MDIKVWLEKNAKTRRNKYALLLGLVLIPCVLLAGLFQLYRNIQNLDLVSNHNIIVLSSSEAQTVNAHHAKSAFSLQMQEWKYFLLYGGDPQDKKLYWNNFLREEATVRNEIELMQASAMKAHDERTITKLGIALDLHEKLGRQFRNALTKYPLWQVNSPAFQVERMVKGLDRLVNEQLTQIAKDQEHEYKILSARMLATQSVEIENAQGHVELNLIFIMLMVMVEALLVLRTVNKSTNELNKLSTETEETFYHLAYSDPLTELPNRRLFQDRLKSAIVQLNRSNQFRALMFLDMDNFKTLNDTKGHGIGDLLLIEVAKRLKSCVRATDTVARLGGDEFVVLFGDLGENEQAASKHALMVSEKISKSLNRPYDLGQLIYTCSASIGVTMFRDAEITIEEVHKRADAAMYQAKNAGRNTVRFYDPITQAELEASSELEHALRMSIEHQQLHVYYQVQVNHNSKPVGAEALIRWEHPKLGLIYPGQFIPIAEETMLILPIGQWALETVCKQIKLWESSPLTRDLQIAVNVSARQFHQPDFVILVVEVVKKTGINPSRLKLELTESMMLFDVDDTVVKMNELKKVGVRFSMDDFGTGYSSLSYLTQLPLDQLKVDQSFVRNIGIKPIDSIIVQTIIGMANNLNMAIIAEGVETQKQREFLEEAGCKLYQGYLYGKPEPLDKFIDSLNEINGTLEDRPD
jgi:diguanylate cyclase (GGDEF)-like protein